MTEPMPLPPGHLLRVLGEIGDARVRNADLDADRLDGTPDWVHGDRTWAGTLAAQLAAAANTYSADKFRAGLVELGAAVVAAVQSIDRRNANAGPAVVDSVLRAARQGL